MVIFIKVKTNTHMYSEPCQKSKMVRFAQIVNVFWLLTFFAKHSILDVWHRSEYAYLLQCFFTCALDINDVSSGYSNPQNLYERLNGCLNSMPDPHSSELSDPISTGTSDSEEEQSITEGAFGTSSRLWITKWVDYSNKYGFGAQLSNGCIVIRYNDGTTLAVDAQKR